MPLPNEHSARLRNPDDFAKDSFRRTDGGTIYGTIKVPKTIAIIWAKLKDKSGPSDPPLPQALRFPTKSWTVKAAKAWLSEHKIKYLSFEPASGEAAAAHAIEAEGPAAIAWMSGPVEWIQAAADDGGEAPLPRFKMTAYTGVPMHLAGWWQPVVVDLAGMTAPDVVAILRDHDPAQIVGHSLSIHKETASLKLEGVISGVGQAVEEIIKTSKNKFPWKASIGARVDQMEYIAEDVTTKVNGKTFEGPLYVARKTTLGEVSFVPVAADDATAATVAASAAKTQGGRTMEFKEWLTAKGHDPEALTDDERVTLEAQWKAETKPAGDGKAPPAAGDVAPKADLKAAAGKAPDGVEEPVKAQRAQAAAEVRRMAAISKICANRHSDIEATAIEEGWTADKTELAVVRAERPKAPAVVGSGFHADPAGVLEAAVCMTGRLETAEKTFKEPVLEAAHRQFPRGIDLQELILAAARMGGYEGRGSFRSDLRPLLKAAFSTISISGILSNIANKFLLEGFTAVEDAWRRIAAIRSVTDFKAVTSYRLTGALEFEEVGPAGELKHGKLGEETFTNQARTYGIMLAITRQDIINDDLGALTAVPRRIGRGGALKLNTVLWTAFLDNLAFFTIARGNYAEGTPATVLGIDGLTAAELLFLTQTDPDGKPFGLTPRTLLVPPALSVLATQLTKALELREPAATTKYFTNNPHAGKFEAIASAYLSNGTIPGSSAKKWYLLADPRDVAVIEVAVLNGVEAPTIESADADFNLLGVQMRGYFDFGVAKQDYRGGVAMKGEAAA